MKKPAPGPAKAHTVAKPAHHAKPAPAHQHGHQAGHAGKAQSSHKHHTASKKHQGRKKRQLALGEGVACCSAEALAASLRLSGRSVEPSDVLALYEHTADGPDAGASIVATLEAAYRWGLAGVRPVNWRVADPGTQVTYAGLAIPDHQALILGVELPGPHAAAIAPDGCWLSWGEHYDPDGWPDAVIEEAWVVTWP